MWAVTLEPAIMSFGTPIFACEQGERWQPALSFLSEMWVVKSEPYIVSYSPWQPA